MSDEFSQCCARFREAITVTGPDIRFNACSTATSDEKFLTGSNDGKASSSATSPKEDQASTPSAANLFSYIDLVEKCTFGGVFAFNDDPNIRKEIDSALMKIAYNISLQYKKIRSRGLHVTQA